MLTPSRFGEANWAKDISGIENSKTSIEYIKLRDFMIDCIFNMHILQRKFILNVSITYLAQSIKVIQ